MFALSRDVKEAFFIYLDETFAKLFKKYLIDQKYAKKREALLAVLPLSLYYGATLRWDGWVAETTSLLRMRTGNCTEGSNPSLTANFTYIAPIAQLDRALGYELRGREFESLWAHQLDELKNRTLMRFFCVWIIENKYHILCYLCICWSFKVKTVLPAMVVEKESVKYAIWCKI